MSIYKNNYNEKKRIMASISPQSVPQQFISPFSVENIISKKETGLKGEETSLNHSGSSSSTSAASGYGKFFLYFPTEFMIILELIIHSPDNEGNSHPGGICSMRRDGKRGILIKIISKSNVIVIG